jgi:hypothetical protein
MMRSFSLFDGGAGARVCGSILRLRAAERRKKSEGHGEKAEAVPAVPSAEHAAAGRPADRQGAAGPLRATSMSR